MNVFCLYLWITSLSHNRDSSVITVILASQSRSVEARLHLDGTVLLSRGRRWKAVTEAGPSWRHWSVGKAWGHECWGEKYQRKFPLASVQVEEVGLSFWRCRADWFGNGTDNQSVVVALGGRTWMPLLWGEELGCCVLPLPAAPGEFCRHWDCSTKWVYGIASRCKYWRHAYVAEGIEGAKISLVTSALWSFPAIFVLLK